MGFPKNFDFGVASSAYQVEGAWNANGKGASIWDTYAAVPVNIADGTTGKVGCDHYHHYLEDIALMKEMGVDSYRFSVSWSRIYPQGIGVLNQEGLAFYDRVVDALLEAGISPILITMTFRRLCWMRAAGRNAKSRRLRLSMPKPSSVILRDG